MAGGSSLSRLSVRGCAGVAALLGLDGLGTKELHGR